MSLAPPVKPLFDLKSTNWILTALRLRTTDVGALATALEATCADHPGLFDDEAVVLDLGPIQAEDAVPDFAELLPQLRRLGMRPVAAQAGSPAQMQAARTAGLPGTQQPDGPPAAARTAGGAAGQAPASTDSAAPVTEVALQAPAQPQPDPAAPSPTLVIDRPLRSGQRIYARGGDLVLLGAVSFGAEVIADGSIHVYAPLRGRAMAGVRGDVHARIFSTAMQAQLVSIAGIYRTAENPLPDTVAGKPAQVRLVGQSILVEPLGG